MSQATINSWFPTLVYRNKLDEFVKTNHLFIQKAYDIQNQHPDCKSFWRCNTYNTQNIYNLVDDKLFNNLIKKCEEEVQRFAVNFGVEVPIKCAEAWFNISKNGNYQEYHIHPGRHFSLVYYVKTPSEAGKIRFKSPSADSDMLPLTSNRSTDANYSDCYYTPEESVILAFRSNIQHMVEANKSNDDRISIAMNFVCIG